MNASARRAFLQPDVTPLRGALTAGIVHALAGATVATAVFSFCFNFGIAPAAALASAMTTLGLSLAPFGEPSTQLTPAAADLLLPAWAARASEAWPVAVALATVAATSLVLGMWKASVLPKRRRLLLQGLMAASVVAGPVVALLCFVGVPSTAVSQMH